ncbi:hypothetical protein [Pseudomonas arsenicoxydans]|uniref:hypothetical protein n=1 Tax=Pseudomonas arsenicoxydans TaxID=702115 RepID=UPI0012FD1FAE|nr:hypothetical protein [Pseudomonas arsenicoxydans]
MTTENKDLPVPVIVAPIINEPAHNPIHSWGTARVEEGTLVTVRKSGSDEVWLRARVSNSGEWSGIFSVDLPKGTHSIEARLTLGNEHSAWSPVRQFVVG